MSAKYKSICRSSHIISSVAAFTFLLWMVKWNMVLSLYQTFRNQRDICVVSPRAILYYVGVILFYEKLLSTVCRRCGHPYGWLLRLRWTVIGPFFAKWWLLSRIQRTLRIFDRRVRRTVPSSCESPFSSALVMSVEIALLRSCRVSHARSSHPSFSS